jgi:hypothetical protein
VDHVAQIGVGSFGVAERLVHQFGRAAPGRDRVPGELEDDDGVHESLLRAVVDVALQAASGLVGGGHDACARCGELLLVLGVGDGGRGKLGERCQPVFGAGR